MTNIYVQEVVVIMSDEARLTGHIVNAVDNPDFESSAFLTDSNRWMSRIGSIKNHNSATLAFEEFVEKIENYMKVSSSTVVSIDNPCNANFIDSNQQTIVLTKYGIKLVPKVNGM